MQSISRNDHSVDRAILALPSAYQEYLVILKLMTSLVDVTCGTKSPNSQEVLDASYAVKGIINVFFAY